MENHNHLDPVDIRNDGIPRVSHLDPQPHVDVLQRSKVAISNDNFRQHYLWLAEVIHCEPLCRLPPFFC